MPSLDATVSARHRNDYANTYATLARYDSVALTVLMIAISILRTFRVLHLKRAANRREKRILRSLRPKLNSG